MPDGQEDISNEVILNRLYKMDDRLRRVELLVEKTLVRVDLISYRFATFPPKDEVYYALKKEKELYENS